MAAHWRITEVQLLDEHAIRVRFTDGIEGVVRFSPEFFRGVFSHLIDPAKFGEAAVVGGAVTWPGGLDLAPDTMYDEIKLRGEWVLGSEASYIVERKPGAWSDLPKADVDWVAPISLLDDPDMQKAPQALMRASEQARKLAEQTGTPFVVRKSSTADSARNATRDEQRPSSKDDQDIPEYKREQLGVGVRGKHYKQFVQGSIVIVLKTGAKKAFSE